RCTASRVTSPPRRASAMSCASSSGTWGASSALRRPSSCRRADASRFARPIRRTSSCRSRSGGRRRGCWNTISPPATAPTRPPGHAPATLPGGAGLPVPLATVRGAVGVLGLHSDGAGEPLSLPQRQLLEAMAGQAAVAIERTRIDAVLEAQAKLAAVIESIEDGLVVVDHDGVVQHVNEVACAILGFEAREAVGQRFERLGPSHPHYLRLRSAVAEFLAHPEREHEAVELALFLRGRDHFYVLRPTPLRAHDGTHAGFILVLQDVTYLRDQERQREQ